MEGVVPMVPWHVPICVPYFPNQITRCKLMFLESSGLRYVSSVSSHMCDRHPSKMKRSHPMLFCAQSIDWVKGVQWGGLIKWWSEPALQRLRWTIFASDRSGGHPSVTIESCSLSSVTFQAAWAPSSWYCRMCHSHVVLLCILFLGNDYNLSWAI